MIHAYLYQCMDTNIERITCTVQYSIHTISYTLQIKVPTKWSLSHNCSHSTKLADTAHSKTHTCSTNNAIGTKTLFAIATLLHMSED